MRKHVAALAAGLALFLLPVVANAEDPAPPVRPALNPEDAAKARAQLQELAKAMGIELAEEAAQQPATTAPAAQGAAPQPKSVADVADKALDLVKGLVTSLSETLQKVAPDVWRIMIRQQYAKAVSGIVVPMTLLGLVLVYWYILKKKWVITKEARESRYTSDEETARLWLAWVVPIVLGFGFSIWSAVRLSDSITYLINPEYYAIRDLLLMLLQPGSIR